MEFDYENFGANVEPWTIKHTIGASILTLVFTAVLWKVIPVAIAAVVVITN